MEGIAGIAEVADAGSAQNLIERLFYASSPTSPDPQRSVA